MQEEQEAPEALEQPEAEAVETVEAAPQKELYSSLFALENLM